MCIMKYHIRDCNMASLDRMRSENLDELKMAAKALSRSTQDENAAMYFVLNERQDIISMFHDGNEYTRVNEYAHVNEQNIDSAYYNEEADYGRHQG